MFRGGNLVDHFRLENSIRLLEFEYEGNEYRTEIHIDGIKKDSKAYFIKNNKTLNKEGGLRDYDKHVEQLLGSEELFFPVYIVPNFHGA